MRLRYSRRRNGCVVGLEEQPRPESTMFHLKLDMSEDFEWPECREKAAGSVKQWIKSRGELIDSRSS